MEVGTLRSAKDGLCALCYAKASDKCSKCKLRWYCSPFCQQKDWLLGHKGDCGLADLPLSSAVPAPPVRLLPESVERPVFGDAAWRRLAEAAELGLRPGPPRGLRNLGNSCYMNSVLQGLYHSAPLLFAACSEHSCERNGSRACTGDCFRCDLEAVAVGCLEPRPVAGSQEAESYDFVLGDRVRLFGLGREELNGQDGIVVTAASSPVPGAGSGEEEPRCGVRLSGAQGTKAVRPQNLALRCRAPAGPREVARWLPRIGEFTLGNQEDAHEFLRSLLRLVEDEELKEHGTALRKRAAASGSETEAVVLPPNADLTASPSRVFGGLLVSQCTCTRRECAASTYSFEPFLDLSLEITEATDSVEDALRLFTAPERLDKKNGKRCETCGETVRARKQLTIYTSPPCLVLHLKRFRYGERGKVTRPVSFSSTLNLRPFLCVGAPDVGKPLLYELRAVIVHLDKAGFSHFGHYVAYVRCLSDGAGSTPKWFLLDDSQTFEVTEAEVLRQQAYLLLYARPGAAAVALPEARKVVSAAVEAAADTLPGKCRGRGSTVCSFFASCDGLCTRCYQEEHGRPPPAPAPAPPTLERAESTASSVPSPPAAPAAGRPAAAAPPSGKAKKVGANEQCPCGSGRKYKRCHGTA